MWWWSFIVRCPYLPRCIIPVYTYFCVDMVVSQERNYPIMLAQHILVVPCWFEPVNRKGMVQSCWGGMAGWASSCSHQLGYWPATLDCMPPEMAEKQVSVAKVWDWICPSAYLPFHLMVSVVLKRQMSLDDLDILWRAGAFHSADHDPFIRAIDNISCIMILWMRSHLSLVIYNSYSEFSGP